ncbi:hypothetical protein ACVWWR_007601 [Bradyrhizobium sp. LM3.2]
MVILHANVALLSVAVVLITTGVQAQSMPPEGAVSVIFTATPIPAPKPMPIGGGREFVLMNQAMAASNEAGIPVLNNMGGRCQLSRLTDSSAKTAEIHGFCTYVDKDGDQVFEQCDWMPASPNNCNMNRGDRQIRRSSSRARRHHRPSQEQLRWHQSGHWPQEGDVQVRQDELSPPCRCRTLLCLAFRPASV